MSSPLSMLRKNRRVPFPGVENLGRKELPFTESRYGEHESDLLNDIISPGLKQHTPTITNDHSKSRSRGIQKMKKTCDPGPSDFELMSSMMTKIAQLESMVNIQAIEIQQKEKKIAVLQDKLQLLQKHKDINIHPVSGGLEEPKSPNQVEELERTCLNLQVQVWEMERFLNDYGMIWVGSSEDPNVASVLEDKGSGQQASKGQFLWQPGASEARDFTMNFDLVLQNIQDLNMLAGEGESYVEVTPGGGRLAFRSPIPLSLYSNGIVMFQGPFRSYQELSTQQCMQDLMDGYFPAELQKRFPDGVPFQVSDRREEVFEQRRQWAGFPGKGQAVGGAAGHAPQNTEQAHYKATRDVSQIPGQHWRTEQFLRKLPKVVVRAGKVIDVRESVRSSLQDGADTSNTNAVSLVDTPALQAMKQRFEVSDGSRLPSACDVSTLRLRSEDGEQTFILKMYFSETISQLRHYLNAHRGAGVPPYDIISSFPQRCYDDNSQTLATCGLTPNATLLLRAHPCP